MEPDYDRMEEDTLRILDLLCREPSVSAEGRALDETAELVEELLPGAGFETRQLRVDGSAPAVYADQPGRADFTLLLYNHYDVQPVDPLDLWDSPPFEPTQRDGKLFASSSSFGWIGTTGRSQASLRIKDMCTGSRLSRDPNLTLSSVSRAQAVSLSADGGGAGQRTRVRPARSRARQGRPVEEWPSALCEREWELPTKYANRGRLGWFVAR